MFDTAKLRNNRDCTKFRPPIWGDSQHEFAEFCGPVISVAPTRNFRALKITGSHFPYSVTVMTNDSYWILHQQ